MRVAMKLLETYPTDALLDELARRVCGGDREARLRCLVATVAKYYGVDLHDMLSTRRPRYLAWPRQVAMALAYESGWTLDEAARGVCRQDHATAIHARRRVVARASTSPSARREIRGVARAVEAALSALHDDPQFQQTKTKQEPCH